MFANFDKKLIDLSFKNDNKDRLVFYPSGHTGNGYILPDEKSAYDLRSRLARQKKFESVFLLLLLVSIVVEQVVDKPSIFSTLFALILFIYVVWEHYKIKSSVSNYEISDIKLTSKELWTKYVNLFSKRFLMILISSSILLVIGGIYFAYTSSSMESIVWDGGSVIFFGICTLVLAYMLKIKYSYLSE